VPPLLHCPARHQSKHRPDRANKYLDDIYAAGSYDNKYLKRLISAFKYEPFLKSLGTPLADLIADHFLLSQTAPDRNAIVVPVPLARKRLRWRGYNQAQIIAQKLARAGKFRYALMF